MTTLGYGNEHKLFLIPKPVHAPAWQLPEIPRANFSAEYIRKLENISKFIEDRRGVHSVGLTNLTGTTFVDLVKNLVSVFNEVHSTGILLIQEVGVRVAQLRFEEFRDDLDKKIS